MHRGHLIGVSDRFVVGFGPEHKRRNHIPGTSRVIVESANEMVSAELKVNLFIHFTHGRLERSFALVDAPSGKGPLPGVGR